MAEKPSNVDRWLERENLHTRKALERASRYFDANDTLTVNTLEAVYGQESSFGIMLGTRGSARAAGHYRIEPATAQRYGLNVSKNNDQRFDIDDEKHLYDGVLYHVRHPVIRIPIKSRGEQNVWQYDL